MGKAKRVLFLHQAGSRNRDAADELSRLGHEVVSYGALRGVVDKVLAESPDLIVIELDRVDVSGRDIARLIRRDPRCNEIPIALWSASAADGGISVSALAAQAFVKSGDSAKESAKNLDDLLQRRRPLVPMNEEARISGLRRLRVLDTPPDPILDAIVAAASAMAEAPIALVSLVDAERQWFKARVGLPVSETPRELAFCAHAIHGQEIFEVTNALDDERFAENPLVTDDPKIRFYAGTPLITHDGLAIGTLCVIDRVPRTLTEKQRESLAHLGRAVVLLLEQRRDAAAATMKPQLMMSSNGSAI
jgi:GAF domain-containing protein